MSLENQTPTPMLSEYYFFEQHYTGLVEKAIADTIKLQKLNICGTMATRLAIVSKLNEIFDLARVLPTQFDGLRQSAMDFFHLTYKNGF